MLQKDLQVGSTIYNNKPPYMSNFNIVKFNFIF